MDSDDRVELTGERSRPRPTRAERRRLKRIRKKALVRRNREIRRKAGSPAKKFHF